MNALRERFPSSCFGTLSADAFLNMIDSRPDEERWQLIDGEASMMMAPPSGWHQRIAANLERHLNEALARSQPGLDAIREIGLRIEGRDDFRAVADLAVLPFELGREAYFTGFRLAAEVLSASNTAEMISRKRELYAQEPLCFHVLIIHQDSVACEVWSRSNDWQGRVFRSVDDRIELPEFDFSCRLGALYRGTQVV
ncbi:Uma2 family endonuclease [Aureimonas psammosilenae]|uniref:Uma2 family endonuclease n=1 Tax=Aureimonas psammosilenae TaxID=2495496 RepID=UPI00186A0837|nr:Uma2 family endonuclease [Aureimonas psammosilenae]